MLIIADQQIPFVDELFACLGRVHRVDGRAINAAVVADAEALLIRSITRVDEHLLTNASMQFIGSATSGIDHVDTDYLAQNNINFVHAAGANARSVAEYVLSCLYRIEQTRSKPLAELTVAIIGHGNVGSILHSLLAALGINCLINDPPLQAKTHDPQYRELGEILRADVISLHVPLTRAGRHATANMIDADFLRRCKPDTILINTSRGEVIDEPALIKHLKIHPDFIAILDVWRHEPDINLALLDRVALATPHIAGYSLDAKAAATALLHKAFINQYKLNTPAWSPPTADDDVLFIDSRSDQVQRAVLSSYDVSMDSAALKGLLVTDKSGVGKGFDRLRKNYPARREFTSKIITLSGGDHSSAKTLTDLGFKVIHED